MSADSVDHRAVDHRLRALPRRRFLWEAGGGLGGIALAWLLEREACARSGAAPSGGSAGGPHFPARAKRVVQVFACGGVSHIDTFDHKPALARYHGKELQGRGENRGFFGQPGLLMASPFAFRRHGESGAWISSLFPHLAECVDEIAFVHSMVAKSNNHTPATFQMQTGFTMNGFPSMGAWVSYGLGSLDDNLPTFVVLPDPRGLPAGGSINWTAGFLPAEHQGTAFRTQAKEPVTDLSAPGGVTAAARRAGLDLLTRLNTRFAAASPGDTGLQARLRAYELGAAMQLSIPDAVDLAGEPEETRRLYGLDREESAGLGRSCLLARRLLERGVRFVQLYSGGAFGSPRINWDAHESVLENHTKMAASTDQPVSALIRDLRRRGLLDDTLFVWATEFGRGPATQGIGKPGRDHHPDAFTCFLAGAGVKKGIAYGASDEIGFAAVEDPVTVHDLHATILHLLGIDHERLTFYHNGIARRLTDVHGRVVEGLLA
jgi:hypothetical protein